MQVKVIVDASADLPEESLKNVLVVPLPVHFESQTITGNSAAQKREFYTQLETCSQLPTTSQATPAAFQALFESVTADGDQAVVITLSSALSGTYQSACIAAADYPGIYVVDSKSVSVGTGILAQYALCCAASGMDAAALAAHLTKMREKICVIALLDTLEYLKRGGRISKAAAFAGGVLQVKPVISVQDGALVLVGKARGMKQGNNLLAEKIRQSGGIQFSLPILLGYTGNSDALLQKYMEDSAPFWRAARSALPYVQVGSVVGTHAGPGAIVAAFFREDSTSAEAASSLK